MASLGRWLDGGPGGKRTSLSGNEGGTRGRGNVKQWPKQGTSINHNEIKYHAGTIRAHGCLKHTLPRIVHIQHDDTLLVGSLQVHVHNP